jgi:ubiquinone/menaquinone biosynthesis C-methylase UbiE
MSFYVQQILPRVMPWVLGSKEHTRLRRRAAQGLKGDIVELGFGAGLNLPLLPGEVESLSAVDPDRVGRKLARRRIEACAAEVRFAGLDGQQIPLDAGSMDCALSTWTLCSIGNLAAALGEVRRVLKPGGRFHFLEHGLAPDPKVARWQKRLNPLQRVVGGGCQLDVPIDRRLEEAGFELSELDRFYMTGPRSMTYLYLGVAIAPLR